MMRMDKAFKRLIVNEQGAVSIYLIASAAALLLVMSALIDYARIAAFEKQAELSAYSGIRSALSAYDEQLYARYGLFGAGGSDRNELFKEAVNQQLAAGDSPIFSLVRMKYDASHVQPYETLGRHDVFKRQILEEMKYKAPIDFTLEVAAKFASVASVMKEAKAAVNILEKVRKVYDKREESLSKVLAWQQEAAKLAGKSAELIPYGVKEAMTKDTAASVVSGYGDYLQWIAHDAGLPEGEPPLFTSQIVQYERTARSTAAELQASAEQALRRHRELDAKITAELEQAQQYNRQMADIIRQLNAEQSGGGFDRVSGQSVPGDGPAAGSGEQAMQLKQTVQAAEQLLLPEDWFKGYADEWKAQAADAASYSSEAAGFHSLMAGAIGGGGSEWLLMDRIAQLRIAYEQYHLQYSNEGTAVGKRIQERQARISQDAERKKQENKAKAKWKEVRNILHNISSLPQLSENQQSFDHVQSLYNENLRLNTLSDSAAGTAEEADDPGDAAQEAMSAMDSMFGGMADMLSGLRDHIYTNEYIIQRFVSFDPRKLGAVLQNEDDAELIHSLSLSNQEVEYILYGFHSPSANLAASYGELFAVRLAVRTMEGLIECQKLGHPLLVLAGALVYGLEQAMSDLLSFVRTGSAPLSKYAKVMISYQDYLRLFLLLHGGGERQLSRTVAVIEYNTGLNLAEVETGESAELQASMRLWFLPGVMRAVSKLGVLNGKVKGHYYETTKTIGLSYS